MVTFIWRFVAPACFIGAVTTLRVIDEIIQYIVRR